MDAMEQIKRLIRTIPDFPKRGIEFRDLTTLFLDPQGFRAVVDRLAERYRGEDIDMLVGVESRGFILAAPLAIALGKGFVPVRKPGKLPGPKIGVEYTLEYGVDRLEIHTDAVTKGMRVLMVDDLLATGGTMEAACRLVEQAGGYVMGCAFVVELPALKGRERLTKYPLHCMVEFEGD
jgi:adenine phosphoribosyltransferase